MLNMAIADREPSEGASPNPAPHGKDLEERFVVVV
jgi:hypothetical protein